MSMVDGVCKIKDNLQPMRDDFDMMEVDLLLLVIMDDDQNVITFVITLKTRAV